MSRKQSRIIFYFPLFVLTAAAFIFGSCEQDPNILTEYDGVNLIANKGFDSPGWRLDQGDVYMSFEEVTGEALPAGVIDAAVYRLEIKNLVSDGQFEVNDPGIGVLPAGWSATGGATVEVSDELVGSGNSLSFYISDPTADSVQFDLTTLAGGYRAHASYILRFNFRPKERNIFYYYFPTYNPERKEDYSHTAEAGKFITYNFPDDFAFTTSEFAPVADTDGFYITQQKQSGYIDDFRVVRTDIPLRLRINLPWADSERPGGLPLVSGWYEFTVWVRSDPDAVSTENRFAGKDVTIGIENQVTAFPDTDAPLDMNGWAEISIMTFIQIDKPDDPVEHVLELSVSPTDIKYANSRDAGSILVTSPSLKLHSSDPSKTR